MRLWKLIPTNSRIVPPHLVRVIRPITGSNIKLTTRNQIHYTRTSMFPRYLQNTIDVEMFGRTFDLIDLDIAVEGLQGLFTKIMKVTPEETPIRDVEIAASLRFLGQPITSTYKRMKDTRNKTLLEKTLPESIVQWRRLAEEINRNLNVNVERVRITYPASAGREKIATTLLYRIDVVTTSK